MIGTSNGVVRKRPSDTLPGSDEPAEHGGMLRIASGRRAAPLQPRKDCQDQMLALSCAE
jgi:hypothetical protein